MKRIICLIFSVVLMLSVCITANAAAASSIGGNSTATAGQNAEFTVKVNGCGEATSIAVAVNLDDDFELVSGTWLKSGSISKFDKATNKGALGGLKSPDVNGDVFKLVLKAKTASADSKNVSVNVIAKNGSSEIMNVTTTKAVKINCASHSYGDWTNDGKANHKHTCSVCSAAETKGHTWNKGAVTKEATCKETGVKTYTCTTCKATKTETTAKTNNHRFSAWTQTKEPTCTQAGTETQTCSVCGKTVMRNVAALGHKFSKPTVTKKPTCTETGIETGTCTRCNQTTTNTIKAEGHKFGEWATETNATCTEKGKEIRKCTVCEQAENREVEALGHDFENPTVVKEPTISSTGLKEGKCKRCGETTSETIPCAYTDSATGIIFEANEGVFKEGTTITVESVKKDSDKFKSAENTLKDITAEFTVFDVSALLNGAKIQPDGKVKVTFTVPEGYGRDVAVYYVSDSGTSEKIETVISDDAKTATAELEHFSLYALCKLGKTADVDVTPDTAPTESSDGWINWIVIVAVVVIAGGITAFIIIKKKKANIVK